MKHTLVLILLLGTVLQISAQSIQRQVVGSIGKSNSTANHQVSWTIGEPIVGTPVSNARQFTQGFQQNLLSNQCQDTTVTISDFICDNNPMITINGETYTEAGNYTQVLQSFNGCDSTLNIVLEQGFRPAIAIQGDSLLCMGTTTVLTGIGGSQYEWSNGERTPSITVGIGTYSVTITNDEGCTDTSTRTVRIDEEAPIFTFCPNDIMIQADASNTATATWSLPTAMDNCGTFDLSSTHESGAIFPIGTTSVIYTAMDERENTSTCRFDVVVTKVVCDSGEQIGSTCDDNDPNTENDVITENCECKGTSTEECIPISSITCKEDIQLSFELSNNTCEIEIPIRTILDNELDLVNSNCSFEIASEWIDNNGTTQFGDSTMIIDASQFPFDCMEFPLDAKIIIEDERGSNNSCQSQIFISINDNIPPLAWDTSFVLRCDSEIASTLLTIPNDNSSATLTQLTNLVESNLWYSMDTENCANINVQVTNQNRQIFGDCPSGGVELSYFLVDECGNESSVSKINIEIENTNVPPNCLRNLNVEELPTAFVPNGVAPNHVFDPLNNIKPLCGNRLNNPSLQVVNIWGETVYIADPYQKWTGLDEGGTPLPSGTYYYQLTFELDQVQSLKSWVMILDANE